MTEIELGFVEKREPEWLTNRYFPSKVGGYPAWLELDLLPSKDSLRCEQCSSPQSFLCQIYAPYEAEHSFHRTIYIFICRNEMCQTLNSSRNITVWRSQLPRQNDFYSSEPPSEDGAPLPAIASKKSLCFSCGCHGPLKCARCKKATYCSTQHQRAHWPEHKKNCTSEENKPLPDAKPMPGIAFPEMEIVIESFEQPDIVPVEDDELKEEERLAEYEKLAAEGKIGEFGDLPESELEKYAQHLTQVDDKYFAKFKKAIQSEPEQVIRYKRGGTPLWIADVEKTHSTLQIPNCEHCGAERVFEFQIMPQLLLSLQDNHLDWGVLTVYTCAKSCQPPVGMGYVREHIVRQDVVGITK